MSDQRYWIGQSVVTDPGEHTSLLDAVPNTLQAIHDAAQQLVFHYRAGGDWAENGVSTDRIGEIDTRYAAAMLTRIAAMGEPSLTRPRAASERLVGCCRDFTVLYLSIARHKGVPARARVGFANYFVAGWHLDHVVAEVFDVSTGRWHLVDPQLRAGEVEFDPLDVPHDRFLTGPRAWLEARAGVGDPDSFCVSPDLDIPGTRGFPYLAHNLIHDLAALNKKEMVLWDTWGLMGAPDALSPDNGEHLDRLARIISDAAFPIENMEDWAAKPEFSVPSVVTSYSPASPSPLQVDVSVLG